MAKQRKRPARIRHDRKAGPTSGRRKPCPYCRDKVDQVDYKDVSALRRFISERGRSARAGSRERAAAIRARSRALSSARELALLSYVAEGTNERWERGERSSRGSRRDG